MALGSILSAVSGGLSLLGSMKGAKEQSENTEAQNALVAERNAEERRANLERERIVNELLQQQREGVTSGTGSRSRYIEGQGFVTELSPMEQTIANSNLARMMREGAGQEPIREEEAALEARRRLDAGADATAERRQRNAPTTRTVDSILGDLMLARRRATNDQFDPISSAVSAQAIRSGNTANLGDLARDRSRALRESEPTRLEATNLLDQLTNQKKFNSAQLQSTFEGLARRGERPASQQPIPFDNVTASLRNTMPQTAGVAMSGLRAPNFSLPKADYSSSNLLNAGASALYGFGEQQAARETQSQLMDLLSNRQKG